MNLTFEWDEEKATTNLKKHKISFDEGKTIFYDPFSLTFTDATPSDDELRYISIGSSLKRRVLVVVHVERNGKTLSISCRKAISSERKAYEESEF